MTATNEIGVSDVSSVSVNTSQDSKCFVIFIMDKYNQTLLNLLLILITNVITLLPQTKILKIGLT